MNADTNIHGLMAEFSRDEEILSAARKAFDQGYRRMDAFTPFPGGWPRGNAWAKKSRVPLLVLLAGIGGGTGGYFMEWYAMARSYPINVAGRPLNSWPAYIPITIRTDHSFGGRHRHHFHAGAEPVAGTISSGLQRGRIQTGDHRPVFPLH